MAHNGPQLAPRADATASPSSAGLALPSCPPARHPALAAQAWRAGAHADAACYLAAAAAALPCQWLLLPAPVSCAADASCLGCHAGCPVTAGPAAAAPAPSAAAHAALWLLVPRLLPPGLMPPTSWRALQRRCCATARHCPESPAPALPPKCAESAAPPVLAAPPPPHLLPPGQMPPAHLCRL